MPRTRFVKQLSLALIPGLGLLWFFLYQTAPDTVVPAKVKPQSISKNVEVAIEFWQKRKTKDPYDFYAHRRFAKALIQRARAKGTESDYLIAQRAAEESLRLQSKDNHEARLIRAVCLMAAHRFEQALVAMEELLQESPKEISGRVVKGDALFGLGRYKEAYVEYVAVSRAKPCAAIWSRLAQCYFVFNEPEKSLKYWQRSLTALRSMDIEPKAWTLVMIGHHYLRFGRLTEARQWFDRAINEFPDYYAALEHRAESYEMEGAFAKARPDLEKAIKIKRDPALLERMAVILENCGDPAKAKELRAEAIRSVENAYKKNPPGHGRDLAEMLLANEDQKTRALALARENLDTRRDLESYLTLARALRANSQAGPALDAIKKALAFKTPDPALYEEWLFCARAAKDQQQETLAATRLKELNSFLYRSSQAPK